MVAIKFDSWNHADITKWAEPLNQEMSEDSVRQIHVLSVE